MSDPIDFAVGATIFELEDNPALRKSVNHKKLRNIAWARLKGAGFLKECSRCNGTGHFGPYFVQGGTCYKCGGSKLSVPRFTQKWQNSVLSYDWRKYMESKKVEA